MMHLTWRKTICPIFRVRYDLEGLPNGDSGTAYHSNGRYVAQAYISGRYLRHRAGTMQAAIKRLNREIDRRSIGLFNVDDIDFRVSDNAQLA